MKSLVPLAIVLLFPMVLGGCIYSREITHIRDDVEDALDVEFERDFVIVIGRRTFGSLGWVARRVPDTISRMAGDLLAEIDRVKVGVFHTEDEGSRSLAVDDMPRFRGSDWRAAVRVREEDATVWVMYRERHGFVRDMLVMTLDGRELVIVRIEGRLDALVEQAIADADFVRSMTGLDRG